METCIYYNLLYNHKIIPQRLLQELENDEFIARIFINRGFEDINVIKQMLCQELYTPTQFSEFKNIQKAVDIILNAAESGDKICIYGDYDVDGTTATAILIQCISNFTDNIIYHIPDRFKEGYGVNIDAINYFHSEGVKLLITCDCGISNVKEVELARSLEINVIITDHHNLPDILPDANVILNPKLLEDTHRARNLSGCGMAYFLCSAVLERKGKSQIESELLDLVALSIISDIVELSGENRYLLKRGMPKLFVAKRVGLRALLDVIEQTEGVCRTEQDIAFRIAPRINAAGRIDSAKIVVELFASDNSNMAHKISQTLNLLNIDRKRIQKQIVEEAIEMVEKSKKHKNVIVLFSDLWHHGIIGIAAGKICETYNKPTILLCPSEDEGKIVGSARSIDQVNLFELIKQCSNCLEKFGGHAKAAGICLERSKLKSFTDQIEHLTSQCLESSFDKYVDVDMEISLSQINDKLYNKIISIGPFGEGFKLPLFLTRAVSVVSDRKTDKNHHIMILSDSNGVTIHAVQWFGQDTSYEGRVLDIIYSIDKNTFKNREKIQLNIQHIVENQIEYRTAVFHGNVVDGRNLSVQELLDQYPTAAFFYEGLETANPVHNLTVDRFSVDRSEILVFLSIPNNTSDLKEIITLAIPQKIIINFSIMTDYSFRGFIIRLMQVIAYTINSLNPKIHMNNLIVKMGADEIILRAALRYLNNRRKLSYSIDQDKNIMFWEYNDNDKKYIDKYLERSLIDALAEKEAYQKFIMQLEAQTFYKYFGQK